MAEVLIEGVERRKQEIHMLLQIMEDVEKVGDSKGAGHPEILSQTVCVGSCAAAS